MSDKNFSRLQRVEREITVLLSNYFITRLQGEFDVLVSMATVKITKDLRSARVYISVLADKPEQEEVLKKISFLRKDIQLFLGKSLRTKYVPKLQFLIDETYAENFRVMDRLKDLGFETTAADFID